jgi:hypothetical protein
VEDRAIREHILQNTLDVLQAEVALPEAMRGVVEVEIRDIEKNRAGFEQVVLPPLLLQDVRRNSCRLWFAILIVVSPRPCLALPSMCSCVPESFRKIVFNFILTQIENKTLSHCSFCGKKSSAGRFRHRIRDDLSISERWEKD